MFRIFEALSNVLFGQGYTADPDYVYQIVTESEYTWHTGSKKDQPYYHILGEYNCYEAACRAIRPFERGGMSRYSIRRVKRT